MKSEGKREIVLITDGQADDPAGALRSAKGLKIDIVYIGPKPAPDLLNDLANASGGSFVDIDLLHKGATLELENKVTLLLGA
jgi:Mg-chelatase subunit ChlD